MDQWIFGRNGPAASLGQCIHSFDVINEPDWVTEGLATLGGGRVKFAAEWDDPAYGLDFFFGR